MFFIKLKYLLYQKYNQKQNIIINCLQQNLKSKIQHNNILQIMYDDSILLPIRTISCLIHKKEKATHLCTDLLCQHNPILCGICFQDSKFRASHTSHESAIKPINQGIQILADCIKRQIKVVEGLYERTLGHKDNQQIRSNLQKMDYLTQEIENRVGAIRMQVELQMELLVKQFQRQMLLQKQQFLRKLDEYKRTFFGNLQTLKKQSADVLVFQSSLKFYSNPNTLLIKLSTQAQKRSLDWVLQQKKTLSKLSKSQSLYSQSPSYTNLQAYISKANQMNLMTKPVWTGQKKELQNQKQLKTWIKSNIDSWVVLPQLKDLSISVSGQSNSHHPGGLNHQFRGNSYISQGLQQGGYVTGVYSATNVI